MARSSDLRYCPRCQESFTQTLYRLHVHAPESIWIRCRDQQGECKNKDRAVSFCHTDQHFLCAWDTGNHIRQGHDLALVDGRPCESLEHKDGQVLSYDYRLGHMRCPFCINGYESEWKVLQRLQKLREGKTRPTAPAQPGPTTSVPPIVPSSTPTRLTEEDRATLEKLFRDFERPAQNKLDAEQITNEETPEETPIPGEAPTRISTRHEFQPAIRDGKETAFCKLCEQHKDNSIHNPPVIPPLPRPVPLYPEIASRRTGASERLPIHQFIPVRPGSSMCITCGNLYDTGNHHPASVVPEPAVVPGDHLVKPHRFRDPGDEYTLCTQCYRPKENPVHNYAKRGAPRTAWQMSLLGSLLTLGVLGLLLLIPQSNHDLSVALYGIIYHYNPNTAATLYQAWAKVAPVIGLILFVVSTLGTGIVFLPKLKRH